MTRPAGSPGSRLFSHPSVQHRGFVPRWRLIILERPGIGLSDPAPASYTYTDFVSDFREFCTQLGLSRVAVIGFSAGTPFATAIACCWRQLQPQCPSQPQPQCQPPTSSSAPGCIREAAPGSRAGAAATAAEVVAATATLAAGAAAELGTHPPPVPPGHHHLLRKSTTEQQQQEQCQQQQQQCQQQQQQQCQQQRQQQQQQQQHESSERGLGQVEVARVALVSAIGPPDTPNKRQGMALVFQAGQRSRAGLCCWKIGYWCCAHAPWLVGCLVRSRAAAFRRRPVTVLRRGLASYSAKADVEALKRPEVERLFLESALEMYGRFQEDAVLRENLLIAGQPWGFDLAACRTPVAIWQGGQDRGCTAAMATHLAVRLGPMARVKVIPEQGHMLYFDLWQEVVDWVNDILP
ncbi:hypothetical protein VOLCADRAFT_117537 [Volvox carteri f. nagariensis]|uniref:AB hydrolase-1 domain-containing protein n=1 Tax=Volvox carteri f. nagariensis TaxID=3068 RepID=D8TVP8_VOLCA|nr:uncharacterized protein VOLCADRAFT_117537 [Volvox carteri f. nagariensis]EFJ48492.1 hypothetical protein VOLCADRAFT_117537 [Volvox carteri f. nagariensis]|eukprot:XP_002950291.1 hypothetical protein VOLCADRAFT_117537 [Volvox carteri f. nagariensis]